VFDIGVQSKYGQTEYKKRPANCRTTDACDTYQGDGAMLPRRAGSLILGGVCRYASAALMYVSLGAHTTVFCLGELV